MAQYVLIPDAGSISVSYDISGSFFTPFDTSAQYGPLNIGWSVVVCEDYTFSGGVYGDGGSGDFPTITLSSPFGGGSNTLGPGDGMVPDGFEYDLGGSISINIPYDLVLTINALGSTGDSAQPFWLAGAGTLGQGYVVDSPVWQEAVLGLYVSGPITGSASFAGLSAPGPYSFTVPAETQISPSIYLSIMGNSNDIPVAEGGPYNEAGTTSLVLAQTACNINSAGVATQSVSASGVDVSTAPYDGPYYASTSCSVSAGSGGCAYSSTNGAYGGGDCFWWPTITFDLSGVIRAMETAYRPALAGPALTISVSGTAGGPFPVDNDGDFDTGAQSQQYWGSSATANAGNGPYGDTIVVTESSSNSANTYATISVTCPATTLSANGDDLLGNRVLLNGPTCEGVTLSQDPSVTVENWSTGTVTPSGGATATLESSGSGYVLDIAASSTSSGGASRAWSPAMSLASYRYLQVPLTAVSSDDIPLRVGIGSYHWNLTTGTRADGETNVVLDLCAPSDGTATSDTTDTHWPIPTLVSEQTQMFGPYYISEIVFDQIPAGAELQIGALTLQRVNAATVDCLPTLFDSIYSPPQPPLVGSLVGPEWPVSLQPSTDTTDYYARRFLLASCDGRQTVEEADLTYAETTDPDTGITSDSFDFLTISDLASQVNANDSGTVRWPGMHASVDVPTPTGATGGSGILTAAGNLYVGSVLSATYLYGGGALAVAPGEGNDGWQYGFDLPLGEVPAQLLFDRITLCGMEGDIFGFGGSSGSSESGSPTYLRASLIVRGSAHGIALTSERDPATNVWVTLKQGGIVVSSATTDSPSGRYHMARAPEASVPLDGGYIQAPSVPTTPFLVAPFYTRHRSRASFQAPSFPPPTPPDLYFPFPVQFSDPNVVPVEEWRRVPSEQTGPPGTPETPAPSGGSPAGGAAGPGGGGG